MSGELHFPVVQLVLASLADRARRKARRSRCSKGEFTGLSDEAVTALKSDDNNFLE